MILGGNCEIELNDGKTSSIFILNETLSPKKNFILLRNT